MSDFPEKDDTIEAWLEILPSITIEAFCERWVPRLYGIDSQTRRTYRKACVTFLMKLTDKQYKTVQNWITYPDAVPDDIKKYLGSVDLIWKIRWEFRGLFPELRKLEAISSIFREKGADDGQ